MKTYCLHGPCLRGTLDLPVVSVDGICKRGVGTEASIARLIGITATALLKKDKLVDLNHLSRQWHQFVAV